jgi:hypothetical protein
MKSWKCACGKTVMYGSDSPKPCQGCIECHTRLGTRDRAEDHQWVTETRTVDGVVVGGRTYCKVCYTDKRLVKE